MITFKSRRELIRFYWLATKLIAESAYLFTDSLIDSWSVWAQLAVAIGSAFVFSITEKKNLLSLLALSDATITWTVSSSPLSLVVIKSDSVSQQQLSEKHTCIH